MTIETLAQQGKTGTHNGLASIETSKLKQIRDANIRACFKHMDEMRHHREFVAQIYGKRFIDDAASQSVNATWYTLESSERSIIWIMQASDKEEDYSILKETVRKKVRMIISIGDNGEAIRQTFGEIVGSIIEVKDIEEAVRRALYNNIERATVIYSPSSESDAAAATLGERYIHYVNEL